MKQFFRNKAYKEIRRDNPPPQWPLWLRLLILIALLSFCAYSYYVNVL